MLITSDHSLIFTDNYNRLIMKGNYHRPVKDISIEEILTIENLNKNNVLGLALPNFDGIYINHSGYHLIILRPHYRLKIKVYDIKANIFVNDVILMEKLIKNEILTAKHTVLNIDVESNSTYVPFAWNN